MFNVQSDEKLILDNTAANAPEHAELIVKVKTLLSKQDFHSPGIL